MRNWNRQFTRGRSFSSAVFSLPMRNWNRRGVDSVNADLFVFSLPMRNWNSAPNRGAVHHQARFQPTYEELKHPLEYHQYANSASFQPTYEELKHDNMENLFHLLNSFQPTYEELKRLKPPNACTCPKVFSLPMRNWNKKNFLQNSPGGAVFSLPMRNWNGYAG